MRQAAQWAGFIALIAVGAALVVWRTSELRSAFGPFFA